MKIRYIKLMTTFMTIIGINAAVLVGYILIYSQFVGEFPQIDKKMSSDITTAQTENSSNILSYDAPNTYPNNITEAVNNDTSRNRTAYSYDPVKQQLFEELQAQKGQLSQEQQHFTPTQNPQNNFYSDSGTSDISTPIQDSHNIPASEQNIQETLPLAQNTQEQVTTISDISDTGSNTNNMSETTSSNNYNTGSPNHSGNSDNFNTYDNPHLQLTTDKYVLNTYSQVFHIPDCNDVANMAEKNYATSNSSYNDIISLGYRPCGHCLKDYPGEFSSLSGSSNNTDNFDISGLPDSIVSSETPTDTYIINKETKYFHVPNSNCKYLLNWTEPQNSETTHKSSDELRKEGYHPCRFCGL